MITIERNKLAIGYMQGTKAACAVADLAALFYGIQTNQPKVCFITFGIITVIVVAAQVAESRLRVQA